MTAKPAFREQAREAIPQESSPAAPRSAVSGVGAACTVLRSACHENRSWSSRSSSATTSNPGLDKFHVHIRCFAAWEFERNAAAAVLMLLESPRMRWLRAMRFGARSR